MKHKVLFLLVIVSLLSFNSYAQKGVRIGYIDTEYILQNVPEYQQASSQLDKKVQQWKTEIERRLNVIDQKKKTLDNERVLLTKELYDERLEDIGYEEAEILDYQQKRFGPNGDLMIQEKQLIQPIQDQIFAAVQEIATTKKYDFIFDKSADVVMLFSAKRYNVSEQVLRTITRSSKRKQVNSKAEKKAAEEEEIVPVVNEESDARKKDIEDKKAERTKALDERRKKQLEIREAKKREADERRQKVLDDREKVRKEKEASRQKTSTDNNPPTEKKEESKTSKEDSSKEKTTEKADDETTDKPTDKEKSKDTGKETSIETVKKDDPKKPKTSAELLEEKKQQKIKDREARKKALEERKKKIEDQKKKARDEKEAARKKNDSTFP